MIEPNYASKTSSRMLDVKRQAQRIPLIRRHLFVYGSLALLGLYGLFFLPVNGAPTDSGKVVIGLFVLLCLAWTAMVFSDELKPEWFKTATVMGLILIFAWLFYRYTVAKWDQMAFLFANPKIISQAWGTLVKGLGTTLQIAFFSALVSTTLGLLLAVFRSFDNRILNIFIIAYVDFFRAMPILVLLVLIYYALPFLGIRLDAIQSGVIGLGLNSSAYVSEIFRAGFLSIGRGQLEAAGALGLTPVQTMRLVLLPQALRVVLPPLVSNYVSSAKDTALCSSISIIELLKAGLSEQAMLANPSPLIFSTALYLIMFVPLTRFSGYLETRMKASQRRISV
jgi:His/Glu/Gln/Arg/opine family amino acid ABC transporter permease subunit